MSTITFQCYACNQVLKVGADKGGRKAKCTNCGTILTIPVAQPQEDVLQEVVEVTATPPAPAPAPRPGPPPLSGNAIEADEDRPRKRRDDDEDEDRPRKRRSRDDEDEEDDDRPRRKRGRDDDDEEDDRPRKRRRDEDDEDDDDRPRKRRSRDDDDEDDDDDDRPRRKRRDDDDEDDERRLKTGKRETRAQMKAVDTGLLCYWFKYLFMVIVLSVALGFFALAQLLTAINPNIIMSIGWLLVIMNIIAGLCGLAGIVMGIIGASFYMRLPPKTGYKGLAIANLVLECLPPALILLTFIVAWGAIWGRSASGLGLAVVLYILAALCGIAGFVVFMLLLRGTSLYLKDRGTAADCLTTMIATLIIMIAGPIIMFAVTWITATATRSLVATQVVSLIFMVTYIVLLVVMFQKIMGIIQTVRARI